MIRCEDCRLPKEEQARQVEAFQQCDHCGAWYHRIGCFTFHTAAAPVPFVNRHAERVETRRLAWLARHDRRKAA
jgi:hypothetical protein